MVNGAAELGNDKTVTEHRTVETGKITQYALQFGWINVGIVKPFCFVATTREVGHHMADGSKHSHHIKPLCETASFLQSVQARTTWHSHSYR